MWTDLASYIAAFDDVTVMPLIAGDSYSVLENSTLNVSAPGVLGNDTDVYAQTLNALLISGPAHGSLALNTDGGFIYTPATNFFGSDSFIYQANDGPINLGTAWASLTVTPFAPVIQSVAFSNGVTTLQWSSIAGRAYRLQFKNLLTDTNWNDVEPDIIASGSTVTATDTVGALQQRFYRVIVLP
jgi:hypothetical protein